MGFCDHCKKPAATKKCNRCLMAFYCNRQCQMDAWKAGHKKECRSNNRPADAGTLHPPTAMCDGAPEGNPERPRKMLADPDDPYHLVLYSTDQSAKGRPEWLFPDIQGRHDVAPPDTEIMVMMSCVISDHETRNEIPENMTLLEVPLFEGAPPQIMVARRYPGTSTDQMEADFKLKLQAFFIHQECPHGIIVVLPLGRQSLGMWDSMPLETRQFGIDHKVSMILQGEERKLGEFEARGGLDHNHGHDHGHGHHHDHHH